MTIDTSPPAGFATLSEVLADSKHPALLDGPCYLRSLQDGRRIVSSSGEEVEDVVTHPDTAATVKTVASLMDMQTDADHQDVLTYVDAESGNRQAIGWQVPATKADLYAKLEANRLMTTRTLGMFGRPPDYGPAMALGFLSVIDRIEAESPAFASHIREFVRHCSAHNVVSTDLIADTQSDRSVPRDERPGTLRVVEDRPDGIVLRGAKVAGSLGNIAHFYTLSTVLGDGLAEDAALWAAIPVNSPGLTLIMREPTVGHDLDRRDHPIDSRGEEMDQMIFFDDVFIPHELVFSLRNLELLKLYFESCAYALWHVMSRLGCRAELFAGTAQAIIDTLGTGGVQTARQSVSQISIYAQTLKAYMIASVEQSVEWCGVRVPSPSLVAAGRLYSLENYPRIMYLLQDLCGQGMVSRWPEKVWDHPEFGPKLEAYLPGHGVSAREKNRLFNFVWELTSGAHAGRVALFENVNATPPAFVAEVAFKQCEPERQAAARVIREYMS